MKILVCGSRAFDDYVTMASWLGDFSIDHIISGAAKGADRLAEEYAKNHGIRNIIVPADWDRYGKKAGYIRNAEMIDMKPDIVIAFWDGISRGTKNTISLAKKKRIPILIVWIKSD